MKNILSSLFAGMLAMAAAFGGDESWRPARAMNADGGVDAVKVRTCAPSVALDATKPGGKIELEYAMPAAKTETKKITDAGGTEDSTRVTLGNAPETGNPGKPVLPVVPCYVALPAGQELDKVEVVCGKLVKLAGAYKVRQGQKPVPLVAGAKAEYTPPDPAVYGSDEAWPKERFDVVGVQKKRGVSILVVNLNPVEYRPKSGQIASYETLRLKISLKPVAVTLDGDKKTEVKYRPDPVKPVGDKVDNPETLSTYEAKK